MWFFIDICGHVETFDTLDEARTAAEQALDAERDVAMDGWSEEVTNIMYGKVLGVVKETLRRARTEEDVMVSSDCDEIVDYDIESLSWE